MLVVHVIRSMRMSVCVRVSVCLCTRGCNLVSPPCDSHKAPVIHTKFRKYTESSTRAQPAGTVLFHPLTSWVLVVRCTILPTYSQQHIQTTHIPSIHPKLTHVVDKTKPPHLISPMQCVVVIQLIDPNKEY